MFTQFSTSIPAGPRSKTFDDLADAKGRRITGIHSINVWVDRVVTGLQVTYSLDSGKTYRAPLRGSQKGEKTRIRLDPDEELIQLSGQGNTGSVNSLTLLSTKPDGSVRLHGPFGDGEIVSKHNGEPVKYRMVEMIVGGSDDKGFSWYGGKIMAFTGATCNGRINGLGVFTAPIVEVAEGLSSTSVIAEDYREVRSGSKGGKKLQSYSSYRSTVSVPAGTERITLWAEEQLKVNINGIAKTLDPVKPVVVKPDALSRITINVDASELSVPAIKLRTDTMTDVWQWFTVHPDVAVHDKIARWDADTLYDNRAKLGIPKRYTREDCAAVQAAVINVAKLGLPGEGQASHERSIDAVAMDDSNWVLDLDGEQASYTGVKKGEARAAKGGASTVTQVSAASGIKKLKKKARKGAKKVEKKTTKKVSKVVVETSKTKPVKAATKTVKKADGGKVVASAERLGKNAAATGKQLAKDVAQGDIDGFGKHLGQGGLQLGRDVTRLGKHTIVTVINVAGEAVEYVLDRTVALGKLMWQLLETLGAQLVKLIKFLINLLPWKAIKKTQEQLLEVLEGTLSHLANGDMSSVQAAVEGGLDWAGDGAGDALDKVTRKLGGKVQAGEGVATVSTTVSKKAGGIAKEAGKASSKVMGWLSEPLEYVNWLLGKMFSKVPLIGEITKIMRKAAKQLAEVISGLGEVMKAATEALPDALGAAIANIVKIADKPAQAPTLLASAMLQLVKGIIDAGVEVLRGIVGLAFGAVKQIAALALQIGRLDLFPGKKAKGSSIFAKIFNLVVGGNTSFFKVVTWLLAIPVTLLHLVAFGERPDYRLPAKRANGAKARAWTAGICASLELTIVAVLDGLEITRGAKNYLELVDDEGGTAAPTSSPLEKLGEWVAWVLALLGHSLSAPMYDPPNKQGRETLESAQWGVGVVGLAVDFMALVSGSSRAARWDFSSFFDGREGALLAFCIEGTNLGLGSASIAKYDRSALSIVSELSGGVIKVVEALIMFFVPDKSAKIGIACAALDVAFGGTAIVTGMIDEVA